ncbi:MAG: hypothetical protein RR162_05055, partial [Oscillospiraceae bacterium]
MNDKMEKISVFLKTNTTSMSLLFQAFVNIGGGFVMVFYEDFFLKAVTQVVFAYFFIILLLNGLQIISSLGSGLKKLLGVILKSIAAFFVIVLLSFNIHKVWALVPLVMAAWSILVGFGSFVSFVQYRKEKTSAPFRFLFSAVANLGFGGYFIFNLVEKVPASVQVFGGYLIVLGVSSLLDGISSATPDRLKKQLKHHVRITAPPFLTALIPVKALSKINDFFETSGEKNIDLTLQKDVTPPNVEVFIHVSPSGFGSMGHVDLAIKDRVVSFGGYDLEKMKLDGAIGVGVLFEHYKKDEYIKFCQKQSAKTLFGFGLVLTDQEIEKILAKLEEIKTRTYVWQCKAQNAQEKGESTQGITDYASELYKATGAVFYKFSSGSFKYYWVLGTNCVRLADTLLCASGLDTIVNGI